MKNNKKIFFASDFHLGLKAATDPVDREKRVVAWLKEIAEEADSIYLLGDIFDFWWEYRKVVPRGFTRFLGTISELTDSGIPIHFFTGNHDMWTKDYLEKECGIIVYTEPSIVLIDNKKFYLGHGEGLGTNNTGYRLLLKIFHNKLLRAIYSSLHPTIGVGIGHRWSLQSRLAKGISDPYLGEEREELFRFASSFVGHEQIDYFIFGHRHLPMLKTIKKGSKICILGDWIKESSYAEWDGKTLELRNHEPVKLSR